MFLVSRRWHFPSYGEKQCEWREVALRKTHVYMEKRLYVGGLPYKTTDDELKEEFSKAGEVVSASIMMDKFTGRSRGFGFVEMADENGAAKAIEMFNGKDFGGRNLVVNEAKPMGDRPPQRKRFNDSPRRSY